MLTKRSALYRERVEILVSIPGIGIISAMELLLELQDVFRCRRAEQLAAYVGLTPSPYSSADKVRLGRITGIGGNTSEARSQRARNSMNLLRIDRSKTGPPVPHCCWMMPKALKGVCAGR
jgi:hypothetical protein